MIYDKKAIISLSGGLDSTCLLLKLLSEGYEVRAYAFNYGQKHSIELKKLRKNITFLKKKKLPVNLQVLNLKSVFSDSNSSLKKGNAEIPEGHYESENMKSTVVENRNIIFSSIIYGKALSWANATNSNVIITQGIHAGDHCFTEDTKILTPNGLKTIKTLKVGDTVYSLDTETGKMIIDRCIDVIEKGSNDEIYNIKTTAGTVRLTSEHKVFVVEYGKYTNSGYDKKIISKKVKDLKEGDIMLTSYKTPIENNKPEQYINIYDIIKPIVETEDKYVVEDIDNKTCIKLKNLNRSLTPYNTLMPAQQLLNLMAWYITEGWTSQDYLKNNKASRFTSEFSQSAYTNMENCETIEQLLKDLDIKLSTTYSKDKINGLPIEITYSFNSAISTLMQTCGHNAESKHIPDWMMQFMINNKSYIPEFIYTMVAGDGHYDEFSQLYSYISKSKQLIEDMAFLIKLCGYYVKISYSNNNTCYTITFGNKDKKIGLVRLNDAAMTKITNIMIEHKEEKVYDISVEKNHNFFAGDIGSVLISNSLYPDCTVESRQAAEHLYKVSNWGSEKVDFIAPFETLTKGEVLKEGLKAMKKIGFYKKGIEKILANTHTCYNPDEQGRSCGKCGSCTERLEAFEFCGMKDPAEYQN